jgi:hypothetical protein
VLALLLPRVPARLTLAPHVLQRHHGSGKSSHAVPQRDQISMRAMQLECKFCAMLQSVVVASVICLRNLGSVEYVWNMWSITICSTTPSKPRAFSVYQGLVVLRFVNSHT